MALGPIRVAYDKSSTGDKAKLYVNVIHQIESLPKNNRIIGCDSNLVLNLDIDKKDGKLGTNMESQTLIIK